MRKILSILLILTFLGIAGAVNHHICPAEEDGTVILIKQRIYPTYGNLYLNLYDQTVWYPDCTNIEDRYWRYWTWQEWNATVWNETYNGNETVFLEDLNVNIDYRKWPDGVIE